MKASDFIAKHLADEGVTHVFELVGGMITHLLDSISKRSDIRIVTMAHEQGAAFAAEGFSRISGRPMVAMATSGPGATNLLTGIGSCYFDSVPVVFITGQVNRHELKRHSGVRQLGFQETDIVSMVRPIIKDAWLVEDPLDLPRIMKEAFRTAREGRPGPVLIDIPMDVQRADIPVDIPTLPTSHTAPLDISVVASVWDRLAEAKRPLILAGGGLRSSATITHFRSVAIRAGFPVVNTLMAVDALTFDDPLRVGLIGSYGNRWANIALSEADVVLVLGSRLDIRQTGTDTEGFKRGKEIIQIDCDAAEVNNRVSGCIHILAQLKDFLTTSAAYFDNSQKIPGRIFDWMKRIDDNRSRYPDINELKTTQGINPNVLMHQISRNSGSAAGYVSDVGQHQMWSAQSLDLRDQQFFITSGGMGAMGFSLPAAIGACMASNAPVVVIAGDGGMQLNIQELQVVIRNNLPLKMIVVNNQAHGMVRQFQDSYFNQRYQSTVIGYSSPDFAAVAIAYGIPARSVAGPMDVEAALAWLFADPTRPALLDVRIETATNVYPKIAFGRPITEMEPLAQPIDMEGT
jgi:acetolactate synthase I/II/III large subunit